MTSKEFNNEKLYQTTMSLMRSLLTQGTITQKLVALIQFSLKNISLFSESYK